MNPWPIVEMDYEIHIDIPEFGETYFGDADSMTPEEWTIVRQISATPMLVAACKDALESIRITREVLGDGVARGVFDGAFLGVETRLRTAIAQTEKVQ